jgi:hypothetical protein
MKLHARRIEGQTKFRECLPPFSPQSFVFPFSIKKPRAQNAQKYNFGPYHLPPPFGSGGIKQSGLSHFWEEYILRV